MVRTTRTQHQCEPHIPSPLPVGSTTLKSRLSAKVEMGKQNKLRTSFSAWVPWHYGNPLKLWISQYFSHNMVTGPEKKTKTAPACSISAISFYLSVLSEAAASCLSLWMPGLHQQFSDNLTKGGNLNKGFTSSHWYSEHLWAKSLQKQFVGDKMQTLIVLNIFQKSALKWFCNTFSNK